MLSSSQQAESGCKSVLVPCIHRTYLRYHGTATSAPQLLGNSGCGVYLQGQDMMTASQA